MAGHRLDPGCRQAWTVLVPVKALRLAKTRLGGDPVARAGLALAMARDVVAAALACPSVGAVLVLTSDPIAGRHLAAVGAGADTPLQVIGDEPQGGLSAAVAHGARLAADRAAAGPLAVLMSDLPALRSEDLTAALEAAGRTPSAVAADAGGVGTVLLTAATHLELRPAYEGPSFAAHRSGGALDITAQVGARLRRDVDTAADLRGAIALGVGPATKAALQTWSAA